MVNKFELLLKIAREVDAQLDCALDELPERYANIDHVKFVGQVSLAQVQLRVLIAGLEDYKALEDQRELEKDDLILIEDNE